MNTFILGIESSCDDTSAAVICNEQLLSNVIANQKIHEEYGGVVPELASRAHQQNIVPVVDSALKKAGITPSQLHGVAFTQGPGLLGSLLVGTSFAKSFALSLNIPLLSVNHMQGHILAHFIQEKEKSQTPEFPFLCLTVSGGHTQIVLVKSHFDMTIVGQTLDDAAGEAFDKTAKLLGLPYPGGPMIDKLAREGNPDAFRFSKPKVSELDFSFSGLKTSILYFLKKEQQKDTGFIEKNKTDLCASIQNTIVEIIAQKIEKAAIKFKVKNIALAGGVSANSELRRKFVQLGEQNNWKTYIPPFEYCTDNAAMIAITGYFKYLKKDFSTQSVTPTPRMSF